MSRSSQMRMRSTGHPCVTRTTLRAQHSRCVRGSRLHHERHRPQRGRDQPDSDPNVRNFGPASGNRSAQQTDLKNWIAFAVRSAIAPPPRGGNPARGRNVFASGPPTGANCVACHSGEKWTTSRVTYDPVDVNPIPGVDTGIVNTPDPGSVFLTASSRPPARGGSARCRRRPVRAIACGSCTRSARLPP